jgi:hypothetical protein
MKQAQDPKVATFLEETRITNDEQFQILQRLRAIVKEHHPATRERMMYGGIMFSRDGADFGGIFTRKLHVSFEFGSGSKMEDPDQLLEGTGQHRRHLKLRSLADVEDKRVAFFVQQAG